MIINILKVTTFLFYYVMLLSDGIQFALMEWLILAESSMVIHTLGSTFAQEVCLIQYDSLYYVFK